ncbi:MAG TPA: phage baseplate assembly protein V [Ideonella sp.]|uniref:phage baseplate assembly protein V n=1 Tax=Ideonella sp. TaxID=1929293 RepID=UPI002E2FD278|nr:phage baseplate assembly protein V [Ideonella sp.]HEX5687848.1 phage baseplate assembly protein V [Ideonella sp.]
MSGIDERLAQVLRDRRAYGKYRGAVVDNQDPDKRGRVKVSVPALLGDQTSDWALPCFPCGGLQATGWFWVPQVGAQVWVEFEGGDVNYPVWTGTFWQQASDVPSEVLDPPTTTLMKTPKGHAFVLEDKDDDEHLSLTHSGGAQMLIDKDGNLALTDQAGGKVTLDAKNGQILIEDTNGNSVTMSSSGTTVEDGNGNKIEMTSSGINVKGTQVVVEGQQVMLGGSGGEPVIKGQSFLTLFATHVHTCTAPGSPTSPAIPQGEMSTLSMKVMTA